MKKAVSFIKNPHEDYKVVQSFMRFNRLLKFLDKNKDVKRVYTTDEDLTFLKLYKLLKRDIEVCVVETRKIIRTAQPKDLV